MRIQMENVIRFMLQNLSEEKGYPLSDEKIEKLVVVLSNDDRYLNLLEDVTRDYIEDYDLYI